VFEADDARRTVDLSQVSGAPYKGRASTVCVMIARGETNLRLPSRSASPVRPFVQAFSLSARVSCSLNGHQRAGCLLATIRNATPPDYGRQGSLPSRSGSAFSRLFVRLCRSGVRARAFTRRRGLTCVG